MTTAPPEPRRPPDAMDPARPSGILAGMRIRKKLIVLHTCFSLVLAGVLALSLRPAINEVVRRAEAHEALIVLGTHLRGAPDTEGVDVSRGTPESLQLSPEVAAQARATPREPVVVDASAGPMVVAFDPDAAPERSFIAVSSRLAAARGAVLRLYLLMTLALLAVYALVAATLELFILPKQVYEPIRLMREADLAVQQGRRTAELIDESAIPADELGEIMRSRNHSILTIRRHERDLAESARQLAEAAADLKRKNHLLETARQNLADADRLASLGLLSAGLSHEMNTPLAVLKGLAEKLVHGRGAGVSQEELELMLRVVGRLERLSESLLDFARVRPPKSAPADIRGLVEEAWTLVRLDRDARAVEFADSVAEGTIVECDADRIVQVLVNLLRNAVDAMDGAGTIVVAAEDAERDGREWISLSVADDGPGIDPEVLGRLFEPFASTRLDAHGTGLGLAVAEGIVKEHGGLIVVRNRQNGRGAVFEVLLPKSAARVYTPDTSAAAADPGTLAPTRSTP
ncbi:MAG: HAMP domain-containing histidine kinase [Phycisphaeraceae bacterium]|nr:HAMP domain-containing histidine kinase [Phycisphaeraceae bacterium]